jgi:hypothetical protein
MFEPFFTTKSQGTGLGLATVYTILQQAEGRIEVDSTLGSGTTMRVWWPGIKRPSKPGRSAPGLLEDAPRGRETLLIVEDEVAVRELARHVLEEQGYRVYRGGSHPSWAGAGSRQLLAKAVHPRHARPPNPRSARCRAPSDWFAVTVSQGADRKNRPGPPTFRNLVNSTNSRYRVTNNNVGTSRLRDFLTPHRKGADNVLVDRDPRTTRRLAG